MTGSSSNSFPNELKVEINSRALLPNRAGDVTLFPYGGTTRRIFQWRQASGINVAARDPKVNRMEAAQDPRNRNRTQNPPQVQQMQQQQAMQQMPVQQMRQQLEQALQQGQITPEQVQQVMIGIQQSPSAYMQSMNRMGANIAPGNLTPAQMQAQQQEQLREQEQMKKLKDDLMKWHLYHEIRSRGLTIGKNQLPQLAETEGHDKMLDNMKLAYWNLTKEKLVKGWNDGTGFEFVFEKLQELVDEMGSFLNKSPAKKTAFLKNGVDLQLVKQMINHRAYDVGAFVDTLKQLIIMLAQLESPYQSGETNKRFDDAFYQSLENLSSPEQYADEIVKSLQYLFEKIDICKSEMDNFYLSMIPADERLKTEKNHFKNMLTNHIGSQWLNDVCLTNLIKEGNLQSKSRSTMFTTSTTASNNSTSSSSTSPAPDVGYFNGNAGTVLEGSNICVFDTEVEFLNWFLPLLFNKQSSSPLSDTEVPLPLRVELKGLHELQSKIQMVCLVGVVALVTQGILEKEPLIPLLAGNPKNFNPEANNSSRNFTRDEVESFFFFMKSSLLSKELSRSKLLGDLEHGLNYLFEKRGCEIPRQKITDVVTQFSNITAKGIEAPIFGVLFKRIESTLIGKNHPEVNPTSSTSINMTTLNTIAIGGETDKELFLQALKANAPPNQNPFSPTRNDGTQQKSNATEMGLSAEHLGGTTKVIDPSKTLDPSKTAHFPNRPFSNRSSLGEKPWYLSYAATTLRDVEVEILKLIGTNYIVYRDYYRNPPANIVGGLRKHNN